MANDFDVELDSIFSEREARSANARREVARQTAATAAFAKAWDRTSGLGRGGDDGDLPLVEVDADIVRAKLLTLIRELFSDR